MALFPNLHHLGVGRPSQTAWVLGKEEFLWSLGSRVRDETWRPYQKWGKEGVSWVAVPWSQLSPHTITPACSTGEDSFWDLRVVGTCGSSLGGTTCVWVCSLWWSCRETVCSLGVSHSAQLHGPIHGSPRSLWTSTSLGAFGNIWLLRTSPGWLEGSSLQWAGDGGQEWEQAIPRCEKGGLSQDSEAPGHARAQLLGIFSFKGDHWGSGGLWGKVLKGRNYKDESLWRLEIHPQFLRSHELPGN